MIVIVSPPSRDRLGRHGVVVHVAHETDGFHGHYHIATHGMTAEEVSAEHDRLKAWHDRKEAKLGELAGVVGTPLHSGFVVTDATIRTRGHGCELVCVAKGAGVVRLRKFFDDPSHAPGADAIATALNDRIDTLIAAFDDAALHILDVRSALGLA